MAPALAGEIVHPSLLIVYVGLNVAVSVSVLADAYFIGRRRAALVCGRNAFAAVGKIAGLIVLAERGKPTGLAIFIAMVLPVAASMAIVIIPLRSVFREAPEGDERALVRQVIVFSLKNYVAALLDGAPTFLLPIIVLRLEGATANAYFYVAWSIASVIGLVSAAVGQVTLREIGSTADRRAVARRAQLMALLVTGIAAAAFAVAAPLVLHIFGSAYSTRSVLPLRILLLATIPGAYLTIATAIMRGEKRYAAVTAASVAYATFSLGLTIVMGAAGGVDKTCLGWFIGMSLAAASVAVINTRRTDAGRGAHLTSVGPRGGLHRRERNGYAA